MPPIADRSAIATLLGLAGRVELLRIESELLHGNALGDPTSRIQAVYLPPGYDDANARYPVLYYLTGYGNDVAATIAAKTWERNVVQRCDALIRDAKMPPVILVVVDGWTSLGGSQYVDSVHNGPYASYICNEVVAGVDAAYSTIAASNGRAVFGHSSGGFGALHLAMRFPDVFTAVASHAGDSYFRYATLPAFEKTRRELARHAGSAEFVRDFAQRRKRNGNMFEALMTLAYAAAYSPRAAEAYAIDIPFSLTTGELDEAVFSRWLAFDPAEEVQTERAATALRGLALCYLDCGTSDEWSLDVGARVFTERARSRGISVVHEEFDGGHSGTKFRFDRSMPLLASALRSKSVDPS